VELCGIEAPFERIPAPLPVWRAAVDEGQWLAAARWASGAGGRLVSVWGSDRRAVDGAYAVSAAYAVREGLAWLMLPLARESLLYPDLASIFPAAARMQRALFDLLGVRAAGAADQRPWLSHAQWPSDYHPLRREASGLEAFAADAAGEYPFVKVEGEGVHEIPVGPVHAGVIEPGHFRFSVVGEKILRLEERLGYTHRGVAKLFERTSPLQGHRIAGRICGDSTVAYGWAYCMALEAVAGCEIPEPAQRFRALLLERERVANHLGDLGALGNDAGLAFGLAQFSRLKEDWLRLNRELFGHRFMMDCVVPGGVAAGLDGTACGRLSAQCAALEREVRALQSIYDEHAGLQDRFITAGRVAPPLAARLGLCGLAGRASGQAYDLRVGYAWHPYEGMQVRMATHLNGDVAARVSVRFEEIYESLRLIGELCAGFPAGEIRREIPVPAGGFGAGWVEGWRGEVLVALELDHEGRILRCHAHDPSWQNWPLLEHAVMGNIVPDFPLINKSFNLSYAGHDG
jgi:Ni,Fe-hydrogenase III large subunit/Ni,Fe-hydrogenase III component G